MKPTDDEIRLRTGLNISTRTWGAGRRACVAIHGWVDNAASFSALAPALVDRVSDLRVIAVDLPGHGQSDWKAPSAEYHYVDWVAILADILDALELESVDLIGHSMGAGIAALYSGVRGERVSRLVMLEGLGPYATSAEDSVANLRRAIDARSVHFDRTPRTMESLDAAVERKLAALPYLDEPSARALVERGTRPVDGGVAYSHDPRLTARSLLRFTEGHVVAMLGQISCPTLVVGASNGLQYPEDGGDVSARMQALGDVAVVEVEGHHHVHLSQPERLLDPLVRFFEAES